MQIPDSSRATRVAGPHPDAGTPVTADSLLLGAYWLYRQLEIILPAVDHPSRTLPD